MCDFDIYLRGSKTKLPKFVKRLPDGDLFGFILAACFDGFFMDFEARKGLVRRRRSGEESVQEFIC